MYLTPTTKHWIVDIETDGLNPTKVWVVCVKNAITKEKRAFTDYDEIKQWFHENRTCIWVGHNFLTFDAPALNRLVGTRIAPSRVVDTFLLSMHWSPSLAGGHSLEAWGERLGRGKVVHEEWGHFSPEMLHRCQEDVEINEDLFHRLTNRMRGIGFTEKACEIEHKAWWIIEKQKRNGFAFDYPAAHRLYAELRGVEEELKEQIYHVFPPQLKEIKQYAKAFKRDGSPTLDYARHLEVFPKLELNPDGSYRAYDYVEFNLGSSPQRVEKLLELGWVPEEFTKNGNPKPTDKGELSPSLARFVEEGAPNEIRLIAQWMAVNGRANAVNNWMNLYNEQTGCIHGSLWLASTLRYRHDSPNTANIPAVRVDREERPILGREGFYTYEARNLWGTRDPERRNLVGVDAKGIQLRVLAHYINNPGFTAAILSADPHTANQKMIGLKSRALTKTITYATLMGAGDKKIAAEAKVTLAEARAAKKKFKNTVQGLSQLIKKLENELTRRGRITLCDGSRILVSSPHMVIPYLLQGDESRIMKQAAIYVDEMVRKEGLDVLKCGDIHDEWQSDVSIEHTDRYIEVCQIAFKRAGETFGYNLPIECSAQVGKTWAETH